MENNNNPVVPEPDASQIPDMPSVDDISVAEMPELEAVPEAVAASVDAASDAVECAAEPVAEAVDAASDAVVTAAAPAVEAVEAASDSVEAVSDSIEAVSAPAAEAVETAAAPAGAPVQVPVVEEYPAQTGTPQYTSYVPQTSNEAAAPEVFTAPAAAPVNTVPANAPVAPTPTYGAVQPQPAQPVRTVPVYVANQNPATAGHGKAVASLVLGIFSLLFSWCCCGGLIPGIVGLCLGSSARSDGNKEGIAKAGIGLNIAAIVLSILLSVGLFACSAVAGNEVSSNDFNNFSDFEDYFEDYMENYGDEMYGSVNGLFY